MRFQDTPKSLTSLGAEDVRPTKRQRIDASPIEVQSPEQAPFEGDTAISAHSVFAQNVFERTIGDSPLVTQNNELAAALSSLRNIVSKLGRSAERVSRAPTPPFKDRGFSGQLPPWHEISQILRKATGKVNLRRVHCLESRLTRM